LFLNIDGTLLDIAPTPDAVRVDEPLRALLRVLERACGGALALVSGRTIADIDDLFEPLFLPVAGVHGCERRDGQGYWRRQVFRSAAFEEFFARLYAAVSPLEGVLIEDKQCGVALHYRVAPQLEVPLRDVLNRIRPDVPDSHEILEGDKVIEFKPRAHDKGSAIHSFMKESPFAGRFPILIGDDLSDRAGFEAVRNSGGLAIAVGNNVDSEWCLPNPAAVRRWLAAFVASGVTA
jgi:trehalose 6-phosphate phosphatase